MEPNEVTHPNHYQFSKPCIEVRDVIRDRISKYLNEEYPDTDIVYDYSNAMKYILRWFDKNGVQDLKKAKFCIESMLELLELDTSYEVIP